MKNNMSRVTKFY